MKKLWRVLSGAEAKREKEAAQAEKNKPGKPIVAHRFISLEPSTFRANLLEARRKGYFADIILEGRLSFWLTSQTPSSCFLNELSVLLLPSGITLELWIAPLSLTVVLFSQSFSFRQETVSMPQNYVANTNESLPFSL